MAWVRYAKCDVGKGRVTSPGLSVSLCRRANSSLITPVSVCLGKGAPISSSLTLLCPIYSGTPAVSSPILLLFSFYSMHFSAFSLAPTYFLLFRLSPFPALHMGLSYQS